MRYKVWALFLILTTLAASCYGQSRHRAVDPDHPNLSLTEPLGNPFAPVPPGQPINGGASSAPGGSGVVSVDELRMQPKAIHELQLSVKAYQSGDLHGAAVHMEKVLAINPQYNPAHDALGGLYVRLHEYDKALGEFEKATANGSRSAQELHNLSATLFLMKRYPEAESTARAALQIDPVRPTTRYVLGCALVAEEHLTSETEELLRQSSTLIPNARLVLARVLLKRGAMDEAGAELQAYLETPNAPGKDEVQKWLEQLTHKPEK
jgi:Tfp pilus assembly protein PilF